jgi:ankyrin repeat protein
MEIGDNFMSPLVHNTQDAVDDIRPAIGWLSPIHMAVKKGHDKILRLLIEKNQDCNEKDSDGTTPLMLAVIGGHEDVTDTLLRHGARVAEVDRQRRSALHWAVVYRRETVLKILLQHCVGENAATINGYDNMGRTPLHTAIDMEFVTGVEILLGRGADVSCKARKL